MNKFRIGISIFAIVVIIAELLIINYDNLSWSKKAGSYLVIISMIFLIISMILSNHYEKNKSKK